MRDMPDSPPKKGSKYLRPADEIFILLSARIKTRVKRVRYAPDRQYPDTGREMRIQSSQPVLRTHAAFPRNVCMKALRIRVHPGIRASASCNPQRALQNSLSRRFDGVLHRFASPLTLPTTKRHPIVRTGKKKSRHMLLRANANTAALFSENCGGHHQNVIIKVKSLFTAQGQVHPHR